MLRAPIAALLTLLALVGATPLAAQTAVAGQFRQRALALQVAIDFPRQRIDGVATIDAQNVGRTASLRVSLLLNRLMGARQVRDSSGRPVAFEQRVVRFADDSMHQVTQLIVELSRPVAPGKVARLSVAYGGNLVGYSEIGWLYVRDRIDTNFTILRWEALPWPAPGVPNDSINRSVPRSDFTFDARVEVPTGYVVATGGRLMEHAPSTPGRDLWHYRCDTPAPFLNIAISRYLTFEERGVSVRAFPVDSMGGRRVLKRALMAMDLLQSWFGALGEQPNLSIAEIPDGFGSQASLVGGIIQSQAAFRDSSRLGELYHELSHLWNAPDLDSPSPRWNEGLASFMEDLLRERVDGWSGRQDGFERVTAWLQQRVSRDSALRTVPMSRYGVAQMTDQSYWVGHVVFALLYEIVGSEEFNRIVGGYYQSHRAGGTTDQFVEFAKKASGHDLSRFFDDWLYTTRWTTHVTEHVTALDLARSYR